MATRDYVVGLPVVVTVDDNGFVQVEVDLAELSSSIYESSHEGEGYDDETLERDSNLLDRWFDTYSVKNEGFAAPESKETHDG